MARLDPTGVSRILTYIKTWITGLLSNKSDSSHTHSDYIPKSGGGVISGKFLGHTTNDNELLIGGGDERHHGGCIALEGVASLYPGAICVVPQVGDGDERYMWIFPNGTWTWNGTPIQYVSDQRLKQQISKIDDKLLDAWEDVLPCQFKYNDAVNEKGDTARLHTGYVVQQIDEACKSHNLDISAYGLYCHEEYPERTEEVEVKQDDGSVIKETKVIEPAREHYSLRYTEALIVECAYLRREVKRLSERLEKLEK